MTRNPPQPPVHIITDDGAYNAFPSLVQLNSGNLLVSYRKGANHAPSKGKIVGKISTNLGQWWGPEFTIAEDPVLDLRSSEMRRLEGTTTLVMATAAASVDGSTSQTWIYRSTNNGQTWEPPIALSPMMQPFNIPEGPPCELPDGKLLLALYGYTEGASLYSVTLNHSWDYGQTWEKERWFHYAGAHLYGCNETVIERLASGKLLALMRSDAEQMIYSKFSTDEGRRWSISAPAFGGTGKPHFKQLPNGTLRALFRAPSDGAMLMGESYDEGKTWGPNQIFTGKTYEYADSVVLPDGRHFIAYSTESSPTRAEMRAVVLD